MKEGRAGITPSAVTSPLNQTLAQLDPEIGGLIDREGQRQRDSLRLIASENYAPTAVMEACGSVLNNKYSEGYAGKRYYEGQEVVDEVETLAIDRLKAVFGAEHINVQPLSGSPANLAVYYAFCKPGDTIMGLSLDAGGHLTHGWSVSITGSFFNAVRYGVRESDHLIDYDEVYRLAKEHKPKLLWCGATAYPRVVDFSRFAEIAREVGSILVADIAHISGLVAGGVHPSPVGLAEVVTSTTHKSFRGPRGGMILCDAVHAKRIDRAVFPGLQGGPHNGTTAGLAVAAKLAATDDFKAYARQIVTNATALADGLMRRGFSLVSGGTDNHLILCDLTNQGVPGKVAAHALNRAGIVCNSNSVPFDKRTPFDPSGIRLGTPALTSRGMGPAEMDKVAALMHDVVSAPENEAVLSRVRGAVRELCAGFPAPGL